MSSGRITYERRLSLFDGTMVVVGGIIGAGIFLNPSIVAQRTGTSSLILLAWSAGGAVRRRDWRKESRFGPPDTRRYRWYSFWWRPSPLPAQSGQIRSTHCWARL